METETQVVPNAACRLSLGELEFGDNGEDAKTIPVRLAARSADPIDHWFWGRVVHDMAGMRLDKNRLPLDYCHRDDEVVGYLNKFDASSAGLEVSGAVTPFTDTDRASEVVFKQKAGVPYEASIYFGGDGIKLEELEVDESAEVNGYTFDGPGVIVREWPLRGVAVCPYGADANTSTEFNGDDLVAVTVFNSKGRTMAKNARRRKPATRLDATPTDDAKNADPPIVDPPAADTPAADALTDPPAVDTPVADPPAADPPAADTPVADTPATDPPADADAPTETPTADPPAADEGGNEYRETPADTSRAEMGAQFREAFGERGAAYFADGLSFEQGTAEFIAASREDVERLTADNAELRKRLSAVERGADPIDFASTEADEDTTGDEAKSLRDVWKKEK